MIKFAIKLQFAIPGYIADPYWPQLERLINIGKESGFNRARSTANRRKALEEYLRSAGMTLAEYETLQKEASRPFYMDGAGKRIIIPAHQVYGCLVAATDTVRSAGRPCPPDQVRSRIRASEWVTKKTEPDGVWERFVTVTAGTGAKLSNQRALRKSAYIEEFTADGLLEINPDFVNPETLKSLLIFAGQNIGIGASRKMGWGRFELAGWEKAR